MTLLNKENSPRPPLGRPGAHDVTCLECHRSYLARSMTPCPYCKGEGQKAIGDSDITKKVCDDNDLIK